MNKRIVWIGIILGVIVLIIGLFLGWLDLTGHLPWQSGNRYILLAKLAPSRGPGLEKIFLGESGSFTTFDDYRIVNHVFIFLC